jgi:hypothetical protein
MNYLIFDNTIYENRYNFLHEKTKGDFLTKPSALKSLKPQISRFNKHY